MRRRNASPDGLYATGAVDDPPLPVRRWQEAVHDPGIYDVEVDTSVMSPLECAEVIRGWLERNGATAFAKLATIGQAADA